MIFFFIAQIPENPGKRDVLDAGSNYIVVNLDKFTCYNEFSVEYREVGATSWTLVSNDIKVQQKTVAIYHLLSGMPYNVRITGRYKYGSTVAEYTAETRGSGKWY